MDKFGSNENGGETMKKAMSLAIILVTLVILLACQQAFNLGEENRNDFPELTVTILPLSKAISSSPTAVAFTLTSVISLPPADSWIAFVNKNNVWLIHPDGSGLRQITTNPFPSDSQDLGIGTLRWSPDGNLLAYS